MPCIDVKDKDGEVVGTVCLRHDDPEVRKMSREELVALAASIHAQARDVRRDEKKILKFPSVPTE